MIQDEVLLRQVLEEFYGLCAVTHGSGQEQAVSDYLMERLRRMGLEPRRDSMLNILCDVPGTAGRETGAPLALQAHMDMVWVSSDGREPGPVHTEIRDGFLRSDGTSSLGADCGIGLAAALTAAGGQWGHGPLRLIFTVDEERGLAGAKAMDANALDGCKGLINLDSFHFGEILISSAGGLRQTFTKETERFFPMMDQAVRIRLSGLLGGHSGDDIGSGRANAGRCLVWLLQSLEFPYELASISAGSTHNAIPAEGEMVIVIDGRDMDRLQEACGLFQQELRELCPEEPEITLTVKKTEMPMWVLTVDERDNLLALGGLIQCGVVDMHPLCPEVVGFSGSMGMLFGDEDRLEVRSFLRSCREEDMSQRGAFYAMAAEGFGYEAEGSSYPAWPGQERDPLSDLVMETAESLLGKSFRKTAVHVGLETSVFHHMAPEIPMISMGMDILDPHSLQERVRLDTVAPFVRLLGAVLEAWKNQT